jgi:hypothetical protein
MTLDLEPLQYNNTDKKRRKAAQLSNEENPSPTYYHLPKAEFTDLIPRQFGRLLKDPPLSASLTRRV